MDFHLDHQPVAPPPPVAVIPFKEPIQPARKKFEIKMKNRAFHCPHKSPHIVVTVTLILRPSHKSQNRH
jgi:hypothetical protein